MLQLLVRGLEVSVVPEDEDELEDEPGRSFFNCAQPGNAAVVISDSTIISVIMVHFCICHPPLTASPQAIFFNKRLISIILL